jgi:putative hydrolase of the HAD superfamily
VDYIRGLRTRYKTGLISNTLSDVRPTIENHWRLADAFDAIILSAEVGLMKPDPRIFHAALKALNVQSAEAIFVDDFVQNVEGARAIGMVAVQFRSPEQIRLELEHLLL